MSEPVTKKVVVSPTSSSTCKSQESEASGHVKPCVYVYACTASISAFLFGYAMGGAGGTFVMAGFREYFDWPTTSAVAAHEVPHETMLEIAEQMGWIASIFTLGRMVGALSSGWLSDRFGRRKSMMGLSAAFTVTSILLLYPVNMKGLYAGRFLCGVMVGALSTPAVLYQSEIAPAHARGLVGSMQELALCLGYVLAGAINVAVQDWEEGWRISYGGGIVFSFILVVAMAFMPESPRWLIAHGYDTEAVKSLRTLRYEEEVDGELYIIRQGLEEERSRLSSGPEAGWLDLVRSKDLMSYRNFVAVAVMCFAQLSGIGVISSFTPMIFGQFLTPSGAIAANLGVSAAEFVAVVMSLRFVEHMGCRILLVAGAVWMAIPMALFALFTSSLFDYKHNAAIGYALIAFFCLFAVNFAYSWGALGWIVPAEIYSQQLRGKGVAIATFASFLINFIIKKVVPTMMLPENMDLWGTFTLFAVMNGVMVVFVLVCLPETSGVDLEYVEDVFRSFLEKPLIEKVKLRATTNEVVKSKQMDAEMGETKHSVESDYEA